MKTKERHPIEASLACRVGPDADVAQITDTIVLIWQKLEVELCPILGKRGMLALYQRSAYLTSAVHPWVSDLQQVGSAAIDFSALKSLLLQQSSASAIAGGAALLQTFYELLTTLVGPSLTEQLLRSVWDTYLSGSPAQDISS